MSETRQQIKDRLIKTASALWGYKGAQAENSFDPLVGIMLGACAAELEKISNDIEETRGRTLERLVQLLYPEVLSNAIPAHAIATAYPSEKKTMLPAETQFYINGRGAQGADGNNIYFSPSGNFPLQQAAVVLMATTQKVYAFNEAHQKETLYASGNSGWGPHQNSVWLAIDQPEHLHEEAIFYFELRNEADKEVFYEGLPHAHWHYNNDTAPSKRGYGATIALSDKPDPEEIVSGKTSIMNRVLRLVNHFHATCFLTVAGLHKASPIAGWPPQLEHLYPADGLKGQKKATLAWVRIDFPENIAVGQIADDLHIGLNCFPVVNRQLIVLQQKLMSYVNIIPLSSEAFFLDVAEITDIEGNYLHELNRQDAAGRINLHYGGIERFNEKNAVAAVEGLIQQLRDESSAFSSIGNDFLNEELRTLQQSLNKLEQQIAEKQLLKGDTPFLILPDKEKTGISNIYVKYWVTNGGGANLVKAGTRLLLYKSADLQTGSIQLLTATAGGRSSLSNRDKVLAYKAALLSKEKLVTAADIAAFCRLRLAQKDAAVAVTKGYQVRQNAQSGFSKTIDVTIALNEAGMARLRQTGTIEFWQQDLEGAITAQSNFFMPLRVFIQQQP